LLLQIIHHICVIYLTITAHGCGCQPAQENPPEEGEQLDENPLFKPLPELDAPLENNDISLQVSLSPHEGQVNFSSSSEEKINCSKIFSHLLHLNS
jgi:hypothetical protein